MTQPYSSLFNNPLGDSNNNGKSPKPCVLVIFGATGDLTERKLFPALYNLAREGQLPAHFACVAFARRDKTNDQFRKEMYDAVSKYSRVKPIDEEVWGQFSQKIFYHRSEFDNDSGYLSLKGLLEQLDSQFATQGNRVFYLSTQPSYFADIIERLKKDGLIYPEDQTQHWSRVIIEKPFGHDLASATELQKEISKHLSENQIYRIDHYLGKETVQNLLVFRFTNSIFEYIWNRDHIDHVQITVAEEIGIGKRGRFWEEAGMLRDIVQNHMMQLLSLVAMEPPVNLNSESIRDEKVKVLKAITPFELTTLQDTFVRGQYGPGIVNGEEVKGYRQEELVAPDSVVETYIALKLYIENWRWQGVPFFLRAGKRLPKRTTEIAIVFKRAPSVLFQSNSIHHPPNVLVIRIQPDEGISFKMNCKVPSLSNLIQPVKMDFRYESYFGLTPPEAYERLICDCMSGDNTLFARADELMASWKLFDPILQLWNNPEWKEAEKTQVPNYPSGMWGPNEADELIQKTGRTWRLI